MAERKPSMPDDNANIKSGFIRWRPFFICLFLTVSTLSVYLQVVNFDFVNLDDGLYVCENPHVQKGLTLENFIWSLTAQVAGNWHPVTMFSHILDCQLYGLNAGPHHLTNLFLHIANTLLLFFVLRRMTGALWQCAFVAALFALHPLHVESVAWVAERKDVLSTFFWMLTLWAYVRYVEHPGIKTYLPVLIFFILGLMAKPMLVTLPFVLLLLDYWPLKRLKFEWASGRINMAGNTLFSRVFLEKIPLFILSAISCIVTYNYQQLAGALPFVRLSLYGRTANAFVSYLHYIIKMIWPFNLAAFYPYPGRLPLGEVLGAFILFAFVTFLAFKSLKRNTFFAIGWLWYIGTMMPVIGLVQVGSQAMADRYTYIPLIGIFIIIAWGVPELLSKWRYKTKFLTALSLTTLLILIPVAGMQVQYWANSISVFDHALKVTDDNYLAHNNLAISLEIQGKTDDAIRHLKEALKIYPGYILSRCKLGELLARQGKTDEAIRHFSEALKINPLSGETHINLGALLLIQGDCEKALEHLKEGLKICPDSPEGHFNMGAVLAVKGRPDEAIKYYYEALKIHPEYAMAHQKLGELLARQGKIDDAIRHFSKALKINPSSKETHAALGAAHFMMGSILVGNGQINKAIEHLQKSLQINNNFAEAHTHLGYALLMQGKEDEAITHFQEAIRIDPEKSIDAYYNLACVYAKRNEINKSTNMLKKAVDKGFDDWDTLKTDKDLENIRNTPYYIEIINDNYSVTKTQKSKESRF